jgi:regulator of sirC expression with transglutaminase-like and TPR domain
VLKKKFSATKFDVDRLSQQVAHFVEKLSEDIPKLWQNQQSFSNTLQQIWQNQKELKVAWMRLS